MELLALLLLEARGAMSWLMSVWHAEHVTTTYKVIKVNVGYDQVPLAVVMQNILTP